MGSSLLALFVAPGCRGQLGFWTILIAHIMFCLSFVVVTVKARLAGLDPRLEQAAMDLYANEWQTFRRITFPLVLPGHRRRRRCWRFSLSFDDFIITNFNAGNTITFPMFVWGAAQRGIPLQINVIGTVMFLVASLIVARRPSSHRRRAGAGARRDAAARLARGRWPTPRRRVVLARRPGAARRRGRRCAGRESADLVVVGGGYTGLWTALLAKERDPGRDVVLLEAGHVRLGRPAGATAGSASASLTHGLANGLDALARRARRAGPARRRRTSTASSATVARLRHRLRLRARPASSTSPPRRTRSTSCASVRRRAGRAAGHDVELLDARRRCAPRSTRRPTSAGCCDRDGTAMVDPARLAWGLRQACLDARRPDLRAHPRSPRSARTAPARARRAPRTAQVRAAAGGARHQRLPAAAAPAAADDRAGLRLRADDRAAHRRAAARDRLGGPAGARRRRATSSTTTGSPRDDRILWGGYDASTTTAAGSRPSYEQRAGDLRAARRALLHHLPAARGRCGSATAGAA